jgi:hypothetical protein
MPVDYRYRSGLWQTARQASAIGVHCEQLLHDVTFLGDDDHHGDDGSTHEADGDGSALCGPLGRTAGWRPYLVGSRRHRGQWISVAAEYLGRLIGATRYRPLERL